jgi:tetratricopeptide (TPR) repeat protein
MKESALQHFYKAIEVYKKLMTQLPKQRWSYAQRICSIYKEIGAENEARKWLEEETRNVEKSLENCLAIANMYSLLGDFKSVLKHLEDATTLAKTDDEKERILLMKASACVSGGQIDKGEEEYKVLLNSKNPNISNSAKRALIDLYIRQGRLDKIGLIEKEGK